MPPNSQKGVCTVTVSVHLLLWSSMESDVVPELLGNLISKVCKHKHNVMATQRRPVPSAAHRAAGSKSAGHAQSDRSMRQRCPRCWATTAGMVVSQYMQVCSGSAAGDKSGFLAGLGCRRRVSSP